MHMRTRGQPCVYLDYTFWPASPRDPPFSAFRALRSQVCHLTVFSGFRARTRPSASWTHLPSWALQPPPGHLARWLAQFSSTSFLNGLWFTFSESSGLWELLVAQLLHSCKEYLNYNKSFVRKRSNQLYVPPTEECGIFGILDVPVSFRITDLI